MQLRQQEQELTALNIEVRVVTFETAAAARRYLGDTELPWPLLLDEDRALYRAYGMERGRWWQIWGPRTLWTYLKLILAGRKLEKASGDPNQLGGDVLVDPAGIVRVHHVGSTPADRPSVESLIRLVRRAETADPDGDPRP